MISAEKYRIEREKLMEKWERECREWAAELSGRPVVATFFKDGVVDPDTWFNNDFRPLFVLKEVHDKNPLDITTFDFVDMNEEAGYDIWNATGNWSRLAVLAEGLVSTIIKGKEIPSYDELRDEFFYKKSRTHHDALKNIAVINIKKLAAGADVKSEKSQKTINFTKHATKFKDNLIEQINDVIKPSVIICCGAGVDKLLCTESGKFYDIPVISAPHINRSSTEDLYYKTIHNVKRIAYIK